MPRTVSRALKTIDRVSISVFTTVFPAPPKSQEWLGALLAVQASLLALPLPLLALIGQVIRDAAVPYVSLSEVIYGRTLVLPVWALGAGTLARLVFDWSYNPTRLSAVADSLFVMATIALLATTYVQVLFMLRAPRRTEGEARKLLRGRFDAAIERGRLCRQKNEDLRRDLEAVGEFDIRLDREGFLVPVSDQAVNLSLGKAGTIRSIDAERLESMLSELEREVPPAQMTPDPEIVAEEDLRPRVVLRRGIGDTVASAEAPVVVLDAQTFRREQSRYIRAELREAIQLSDAPSAAGRVLYELSILRAKLMSSIRDGDAPRLSDAAGLYEELAASFLRGGGARELGYSLSDALALRAGREDAAGVVATLRADFFALLDEGLREERREVILELLALPPRLASVGLSYSDSTFFGAFLRALPLRLYETLPELKSEGLRRLVADRTWRTLSEFAALYIPAVARTLSGEAARAVFEEGALGILQVFGDLLRRSFDRRDRMSFQAFATALSDVEERWTISSQTPADIEDKFRSWSREVRFVIEAWMLRAFLADDLKAEEFRNWASLLGDLGTEAEMRVVLGRVLDDEFQGRFGWSWWWVDPEPGRIGTTDWGEVREFYWVFLLRVAQRRAGTQGG